MHLVLASRLGGLSLPGNSVIRLTDRPYMCWLVGWLVVFGLAAPFFKFIFLSSYWAVSQREGER